MSWFRRNPDEPDLEAEINFHLEQEAQLLSARGETSSCSPGCAHQSDDCSQD
jgi:hypothetical protein